MTLDLDTPLRELRGIGPSRERQLASEGVRNVGDLLSHLPSRYEDRRTVSRIEAIEGERSWTFEGRLRDVRLVMRRGRRFTLVRGMLEDDSGSVPVAWFNQPYISRQIDPEADYLVHGRVKRRENGWELQNPSVEPTAKAVHARRIVPVYPPLGPLGPAMVRRVLTDLTTEHDLAVAVSDPLPEVLLERRGLAPLGSALARLHRPTDQASVERLIERSSSAHRRLIYGELLEFQLRIAAARRRAVGGDKGHRVVSGPDTDRLVAAMLPFELTDAQQRVVGEIVRDLERPQPMRRLVQGDVGSGKTAVAAAALVNVLEAGLQGAFMAPTELLAEQHHATFRALLGDRYRVELVTGSTVSPSLKAALADGSVDLAVGTHALIQEGIEIRRLGLAIVDEQHRFGVAQRTALGAKGDRTDLLVMTATPIPRTLTLTAYGDLDLSVIDELPPGRVPVETDCLAASDLLASGDLAGLETRLREELARGGQAYLVFPAIRRREGSPGVSVEEGVESLGESLRGVPLGVVHGQLPIDERSRVMGAFAAGEIGVLLATTVIEVGVDVPAATLMVIVGAERFGLAQLHQLRGRVGRGGRRGRCIAIHGELTEEGRRRLDVFSRTTDGFEIAEEDLLIRGPGELLGRRQAGVPRFRVADLRADTELLEMARLDAREILRERPDLLSDLGGERSKREERLARA